MILTLATAALIAVCPAQGPRTHCVVDGDTVWLDGEKIRLVDIDAPELAGRCEIERRLAIAARDRLVELLRERPADIVRTGTDRYGRTLARLGDVGEQLIAEGLASRWPQRRDWCRVG
jgi:endonuclease YncB( thermonuclease family)